MSGRARRDFEALTPRGQQGRVRELALDALREYDLEVVRCSLAASSFNTVFRVDAADGSRYALRVSPSLRIHADDCELVEAAWTRALRTFAGVSTPRVIQAKDSSVVVWVDRSGVPGRRSCVLFDWVPGRSLKQRITADLVRKTGALAAVVHEHAASYVSEPPSGALIADRVLYIRVADRIDELRPRYGSVLTDALDRAQQAFDALWREPPHSPHLLHGDVQPGNVMAHRGAVTLIDFQDLIWGFEVQDLEITLLALQRVDAEDGVLTAAFRDGYSSVRPWPDADAETVAAMHAARHLNILNFGLSVRAPGLDEAIARHAGPVIEWMKT